MIDKNIQNNLNQVFDQLKKIEKSDFYNPWPGFSEEISINLNKNQFRSFIQDHLAPFAVLSIQR